MLRSLLCLIGLHDWGEWRKQLAIFSDEEEKGPQPFHARWCIWCGKEDQCVMDEELDEALP